MAECCFVIMPYGNGFDEIYEKVYVPAIQAVGLASLRADEIYSNEAIIKDIDNSIRTAKIILADVTGRNPNVNYELGAAHALGKEVIILTAQHEDVPTDYRHLRYVHYNRTDIDWNQHLFDAIVKTLKNVLRRMYMEVPHKQARLAGMALAATTAWLTEPDDEDELDEDKAIIAQAKKLDFQFQQDTKALNHALLRCKQCHIMLESRAGPVAELDAAMACLLNEKVRELAYQLPEGHHLRMRRVFFDLYATHGFYVDYLYNCGRLPIFTKGELCYALEEEFCGQVFLPDIRYLEENFGHDRFFLDNDQYYQDGMLRQERHPIALRDGFYVADISNIFQHNKREHCFYKLDGLLPLSALHGAAYCPEESHWLADWNQEEPQCRAGDTVQFKVTAVRDVKNWGHAKQARNVEFAELKVVSKRLILPL